MSGLTSRRPSPLKKLIPQFAKESIAGSTKGTEVSQAVSATPSNNVRGQAKTFGGTVAVADGRARERPGAY